MRQMMLSMLLLVFNNAFGQNYPTSGLLYSVRESHSLTYYCTKTNDGGLECDFNQTIVRKKGKPSDWDDALKRARDEAKRGVRMTAKDCRDFQQMIDVLEGRAKPKEPMPALTALQKKDGLALIKAFLAYCKSKNEQDYIAVLRLTHEKDLRTCIVASNHYKQRFRGVASSDGTTTAWVVAQDGPEGPCGTVNLSRFEVDKDVNLQTPFWTYTARKAVTNPNGTLLLGTSCKALDEEAYLYDWKSQEHAPRCDYISFSPL
jgi:hypothetical protein